MRIAVAAAAILVASMGPMTEGHAQPPAEVQNLVTREIRELLPGGAAGGVAVAVRLDGRSLFFNYGYADVASKRPVTPDFLFNLASLRKPFEAIVLADAVLRGEVRLDDPVARYVTELDSKADIGRVTIGQLATHTSGLLLPQDHPPWPTEGYTFAEFMHTLNTWKAGPRHEPGGQHEYTHAGYVLLQLALERALKAPIAELIERRVTGPLHMDSTVLPARGEDGHAELPHDLRERAVQGYDENGRAIGGPGDQQSYYHFPGTGQMFSSARDLAKFAAANLGEGTFDASLTEAMKLAQQPRVPMTAHVAQALAWEVNSGDQTPIVEKNGGLNNSSTYIGLVPARHIAVIILTNRGDQNPAEVGRRILSRLMRHAA
jgi:beta-lactamase class C